MANIQTLRENLRKTRAQMQALETKLKASEAKQFAMLPEQVGLRTIDELIKALASYASPRMRGMLGGVSRGKNATAPKELHKVSAKGRKRRRARITDELRAKVVEAIKAGGRTGVAIAKEFGISMPSVANIKNAAGLTRKRKTK